MRAAEKTPLAGVPDQAIYEALRAAQAGSWNDKCAVLEEALVRNGWTPPVGHPLRRGP
ncbi:MAG TPA: hypothetical protein VGH15_05650 [Caulobacteraceae bacterium]